MFQPSGGVSSNIAAAVAGRRRSTPMIQPKPVALSPKKPVVQIRTQQQHPIPGAAPEVVCFAVIVMIKLVFFSHEVRMLHHI